MASAGWTPRSRADVGHRRVGREAVLVDPDALEVGRAGLGADPGVGGVVGMDGRVHVGAPPVRVAEDRPAARRSGRARRSDHAGSRSKGSRVLRESSTEMPRQWVWAIIRAPRAAASSRKSISQSGPAGGHQPEGHRHAGGGGQCGHPVEGVGPDLGVGCGHAGVGTLEDAVPEPAHHADQRGHLVPRGQPGGHRAAVGRLVVLGARRARTRWPRRAGRRPAGRT